MTGLDISNEGKASASASNLEDGWPIFLSVEDLLKSGAAKLSLV